MSEGIGKIRDMAGESVKGQGPNWKNALTRAVAREVDSTLSQDGEKLPETEQEYRTWIRSKILERVKSGNFEGINPNAFRGLKDDLRAWVYRGEVTPTDDEIIQFVNEILASLPEEDGVKDRPKYSDFKSEAEKLKSRANARLSGQSQ